MPRILLASTLAVLFLAGLRNRLPMASEGLWQDETISIYIAKASTVGDFLHWHRVNDFNPPLFNAILAGWGRVFGFGETSVKALAFSIGILAAAAGTAVVGSVAGAPGLVLGAFLILNNPVLYRMSGEARPYSLSVLCAALALLAVDRARQRIERGAASFRLLLVTTVFLVLLAYSHYAGTLMVAALGAAAALGWLLTRERFWRSVAAACALSGVAFLPWVPVLWEQVRVGIPYNRALSWADRWYLFSDRLRGMVPAFGQAPLPEWVGPGASMLDLWIWFALLLVLLFFFVHARETSRRAEVMCGLLLASALPVLVVMTFGGRGERYRTLPAFLLSVVAALLLADGLVRVGAAGTRVRTLAGLGLFVLLAAVLHGQAPLYTVYRAAGDRHVPKSTARTLCRQGFFHPGDLVLVAPEYLQPTIWYYCGARLELHGFVGWDDPILPMWRGYGERWASPDAVSDTVVRISRSLDRLDRSRLLLVWHPNLFGPPIYFNKRIGILRAALEKQFLREETYGPPGRYERVLVTIYRTRARTPTDTR